MSKELENEVPLSSKEARMKLHYLYYQQFHSLHRMYRTNATRAEHTYIYSIHRADWLEPVLWFMLPASIIMLIFVAVFAGISYFGKDGLGNMLVPLLVLSGLFVLAGLIGVIIGIVRFISLVRARSKFIKDFLADERTSECRSRKKAAKWLWDFVAEHTMRGEAVLKYTYVPEWFDEYAYLLKWV